MNAIIWWVIVGLIAGWATGKLMKGSGYGALMDIVIGIIGAIVGGYVMTFLGVAYAGDLIYTIVVAIIGACLFVAIVRMIGGRRALP